LALDCAPDRLPSSPQFVTALHRLKIDLSEDEISRVWSRLVSQPVSTPTGAHHGADAVVGVTRDLTPQLRPSVESLTKEGASHQPPLSSPPLPPSGIRAAMVSYDQFEKGVSNVALLRSIVSQLSAANQSFTISNKYNFHRSTNDNYGVLHREFYGPYAGIRARVDYSYHTNYTKERQEWQDRAIDSVVNRTAPVANPWVVYTCGPMGAGKGYVISWMSKNGIFPLEDIVHIDPDHFKELMPEWAAYMERPYTAPKAGDMCHRESAFLQEIAQEIAMRSSQNVWVDGSLRDGSWFTRVFRDLRRRFPRYKLAILEVGASESVVRYRVARRAELTGRMVPEHLILESLRSVASTLELLTPLVDFVARVNNDLDVPVLRAYIRVDSRGHWGVLQKQFAQSASASDFPGSLAPLHLLSAPTDLFSGLGVQGRRAGAPTSLDVAQMRRLTLHLDHPLLAPIRHAFKSPSIDLSPPHEITLLAEARERAGIPSHAVWFSFAYPSSIDWEKLSAVNNDSCADWH
jgi:hypothetical protein